MKNLIKEHFLKLSTAKKYLTMSRKNLPLITGFLTCQCQVRKHFYKMVLLLSARCRKSQQENKTIEQILYDCPILLFSERFVFDVNWLTPADITKVTLAHKRACYVKLWQIVVNVQSNVQKLTLDSNRRKRILSSICLYFSLKNLQVKCNPFLVN